MVNLCISGDLSKDIVIFSLNGETKTIDQFCKCIYFSLEENKTHRIYFEQKTEKFVPRYAEILLNILSLPIRGVFNIITFNVDHNWQKEISAIKVSGYIDINPSKDMEITFELRCSTFDEKIKNFNPPAISFSSGTLMEQSCFADKAAIVKKHVNYLLNIGSVSAVLFALLLYLQYIGLKNQIIIGHVAASVMLIAFAILVICLVINSFKRKKVLIELLMHKYE